MQRGLAIFGGTFDPIHFGHLRSAIEVADYLALASVRLIPVSQPAHRGSPISTLEHRLEMLRAAVSEEPSLEIDERECNRPGPSYMVDTLASMRKEFGTDLPIILVLGVDSFLTLPEWYRWEKIIQLAHILVLARPGWERASDNMVPVLIRLLTECEVDSRERLLATTFGSILRISLTQLNIAASQIRQLVADGQSVRHLVPDSVVDLIRKNGIYTSGIQK